MSEFLFCYWRSLAFQILVILQNITQPRMRPPRCLWGYTSPVIWSLMISKHHPLLDYKYVGTIQRCENATSTCCQALVPRPVPLDPIPNSKLRFWKYKMILLVMSSLFVPVSLPVSHLWVWPIVCYLYQQVSISFSSSPACRCVVTSSALSETTESVWWVCNVLYSPGQLKHLSRFYKWIYVFLVFSDMKWTRCKVSR